MKPPSYLVGDLTYKNAFTIMKLLISYVDFH